VHEDEDEGQDIPFEEIPSSPHDTEVIDEGNTDNQDEAEEEALPMQERQVQRQKDLSSLPEWLQERIKESCEVEEYQPIPIEEVLVDVSKEKQKKKATTLSKITKDETSITKVHVVVPRVEKNVEDIVLEDYDINTIDLGPLTGAQVEKKLQDSVTNARAMIR